MVNIPTMQQLLEAGVHFGHQVRRGHPKMGEYIYGVREGVHIINLESSEKLLQQAADVAFELGKNGKVLLFVGTKKQAQPIVKAAAEKVGAPFVDFRWMGGTLTNFDEIRKNIKKLIDLQNKKEKGELGHYTKKEQLLIARKLEKFEKEWGGVAKIEKLPDALFIIDCVTEKTAIAEGLRVELPIIGIADTNCNPHLITYPIPGNDDAAKSIKILTDAIADAYGEGLKAGGKAAEKAAIAAEKAAKKLEEKLEVVTEPVAEEVAVAEEEVEKKAVKEAERIV